MKKTKYPPISIIIPNWNGGEKITRCLNSIKSLDYPSYEVIVIDNNSSDGSNKEIKKKFGKFKKFKLIENKENKGLSKALNQGIKNSKSDFLLFLDNDVILNKDLLYILIEYIKNPKIGIVSPKIYYYKKPKILNATGFSINSFIGKTRVIGMGEADVGQFSKKEKREFVQGAVFLTKKEIIKKVGLMDESFFVYYLDADFCLRVRKARYEIAYIPFTKAWHDGNTKEKGFTPFRIYHFTRSKLIFMRKNTKFYHKIFFFPFFFLFYTPYQFFKLRKKNLLKSYFKGIRDGFFCKIKR